MNQTDFKLHSLNHSPSRLRLIGEISINIPLLLHQVVPLREDRDIWAGLHACNPKGYSFCSHYGKLTKLQESSIIKVISLIIAKCKNPYNTYR